MLKLLLDEHVSPRVAEGLRRRHRSLVAICMRNGKGANSWDNRTSPVCSTQQHKD